MLSHADPDGRRALASAQLAIDTDRRVLIGWMQAATASRNLGHDEATFDFARQGLGTKRRDQPASERDTYPRLIAVGHIYIDQATGTLAALRDDLEVYKAQGQQLNFYAEGAQVAALLHDEATAALTA